MIRSILQSGSLRARIGLAFSMLLLATTIIITVVLAAQTANSQINSQKRLVQGYITMITPVVARMLVANDFIGLDNYMKEITTDPMLAGISITNRSGTKIYEYTGYQETPSWLAYLLTRHDFDQESYISDINVNSRSLGYIEIALSYKQLNESIRNITINGIVLCFVLLIISLFLIYTLLTRFTAPLKPLTEMAREVSRGNWTPDIKLIESGSWEIQELNQAFKDGSNAMQHYISSLEETRELLEFSENKLRNLINSMHEILFELDPQGIISFLNPAWKKLTGMSVDDALGKHFVDFVMDTDVVRLFGPKYLNQLNEQNREISIKTVNGSPIWVTLEASAQFDGDGNFTGVIGTLGDITESVELNKLLSKYQDELYHMSVTDPLTELYNRRHFDTRLEVIISDHLARSQSVCLLLIDLDGFKFINDTYGHPYGDKVLRTVAKLLKDNSSAETYISRMAGDEFALVFKNTTLGQATKIAEELHQKISNTHVSLPIGHIQIQCSIGIAEAPTHGQNAQALVTAADVALYQSKRRGRNRVEVLSPAISKGVMSIFNQGFQLRNALENNDIVPAFQPICSIKTGKPVAYEILARMRINGSIIDASEFISVAEELGLTREVDIHIITQALKYTDKKQALFLNINLTTFNDRSFVDELTQLLKKECNAGRDITIEITEREAVAINETLLADLNVLRNIGCKLALDDFGSGYSTYSFLTKFKPEYIKIEGSFVLNMLKNDDDRKIIEHIGDLASSFGILTIAESIEDDMTLKELDKIGIDCGQGHFLGEVQLLTPSKIKKTA